MKALIFLSLFVFGTKAVASPEAYQNLLASKKLQYLTQKVQAQPYEKLPDLNLQLSFGNLLDVTETMLFLSKSFDHTSDEMPEGRAKIIHPLGVTAPVVWRPSANNYTGIFQTGGVGLARLSLAGVPDVLGFTPGMGLKILVDGRPSVNLQVMYSLDGQGKNQNFFQNNFSNNIPAPKSLLLKPLAFLFSLVKNPPTYLPVVHFASVTDKGLQIEAPVAPYSLHFRPHADVAHRFPSKTDQDFRNQLASLEVGTVLYEIWAKKTKSAKATYIGELELADSFVASQYQDQQLFFQHQR